MAVRGPVRFWWAVLIGHVGVTLVVYAGVGLLWLVDAGLVRDTISAPDYGISLVGCVAMGMVAGGAWMSYRADRTGLYNPLVAVLVLSLLIFVNVFSNMFTIVQHVLAFGVGLAAARYAKPSRR
jgi:hypothetical protein